MAVNVANHISVMNQREAPDVSVETVRRTVSSRVIHCISVLTNLPRNFELVTRRSSTRCAPASSTHPIVNSNFLSDSSYYIQRVHRMACAIRVRVRVFVGAAAMGRFSEFLPPVYLLTYQK